MTRRRILFLTDVTPRPLESGQRVRVRHLMAACQRVADVTLVAPRPPESRQCQEVEAECKRVVWLDQLTASGWCRLRHWVGTIISMVGLPFPSRVRAYLPFRLALEQLDAASFDLIWAERPHIGKLCAPYLHKTIVDLDDLDHVKMARRRVASSSARARVVGAYRVAYYRRLELSWARRCLAAIICSAEDRAYLERHGSSNAVVVPNGAALPLLSHQRERSRTSPLRMTFLGNLGYEPNRDALEYFVTLVLPALHQVAPEATLDVIGANRPGEIPAGSAPQVRYLGFVENLDAALAAYDVMVVPLRVGGGTKLKVLDAMARGLPVVTSPVGAEGLGLVHGVSAWIAETPAQFVDGVMRMKTDPEFAGQIAASALALITGRRLSWTAIEEQLAQWISLAQPQP